MINRKALIQKHNPTLATIETDSPLTVGNGELAFTADVTGMQTLYDTYHDAHMPLCTMSQWGWHTAPGSKAFTLDDVEHTAYPYDGREIHLPVEKKPGSEEAYQWLRENPHRPNLARIGLTYGRKEIQPSDLSDIHQELDLYTGVLKSSFQLRQSPVNLETLCDSDSDTLAFKIEAASPKVKVRMSFPYGSHLMSGSDWESVDKHQTDPVRGDQRTLTFKRKMDDATFYVTVHSNAPLNVVLMNDHQYELWSASPSWEFTVHFSKTELAPKLDFQQVISNSQRSWASYWERTGIVDVSGSTDPRAHEWERRLILSQYLLAIQSSGSAPPQETGLTCNSWHGKFHLEMHPWHSAWMPLYNQGSLLKKSLPWYESIIQKAEHNAAKNGFAGAKWPKQVAVDGIDSPSPIATVLIWQQSHLIYMLELLHRAEKSDRLLEKHWELVARTADFMCDYLVLNDNGLYELRGPIIPAQEEHDPTHVLNPTFELEYWRHCLGLAIQWADRLEKPHHWQGYYDKLAESPKSDVYLAHANCPQTFEAFNRDHPSMLGALGFIPNERIDQNVMKATLDKVLDVWEFETMWGWDFALMAMTATRLGLPDLAMDILLMDTPKNDYVASGNNYQRLRTDLPLYLPGNGSLLLATALMVAGYEGSKPLPGIPQKGWQVRYENIHAVA